MAAPARCSAAIFLAAFWIFPRAPAEANETVVGSPLVLEANGGWHGPTGHSGLALVYDRGGMFSAGFGAALDANISYSLPAMGLFGRMRALRAGPFSLGVSVTLSRGNYGIERIYGKYPASEDLRWTWAPGYRATGALAAELAGKRWSLRIEGGIGYLLNEPTCAYYAESVQYRGRCNSSSIPAAYHFAIQPGRVMPSVTASVGYRFGVNTSGSEGLLDGQAYRSPSVALVLSLLPTLGSIAVGTGLLYLSHLEVRPLRDYGIATLVLGLSIAPIAGHIYSGEYDHALLMSSLRLATAVLGVWVLRNSVYFGYCENSAGCGDSFGRGGQIVGVALLLAVPVTGIYDIIDAPRAARRSNERHGLTNLGLIPVVPPGGPTPYRGLALGGQF